MNNSRVDNFINFLYEDTPENNKIIDEELKSAGIDTVQFQKKMLDLLEIRERDLKYEKGRKLKKLFEKLKERIKTSEFGILEHSKNYPTALAFRNMEDKLSDQEIDSILKDEILLEELAKELEKNSD
ncbi:MAG: hypothetical protein IPH62_17850 [Ignavibacteriae bacterium]|nr:hypothetical protein [Ignavibacteriota bacterium]